MILSMTNFEVMFALGGAIGSDLCHSMNCPNKAPVPTTPAVTPAADAPVAPAGVAAHL